MNSEIPNKLESTVIMSTADRPIKYSVNEQNGQIKFIISREVNGSTQQLTITHLDIFNILYFLETSFNMLKTNDSVMLKRFKEKNREYHLVKAVLNVYFLTAAEYSDRRYVSFFDFEEFQLQEVIEKLKKSIATHSKYFIGDASKI